MNDLDSRITLKSLIFFAWALPLTLYGSVVRRRPAAVLGRVLGHPSEVTKDRKLQQTPTSDAIELLVGLSAKRAARFLPGDHNCLTQAIAAQQMLRFLGKSSQVLIGLKQNPGEDQWAAHAWLNTPIGNVVGGEVSGTYTPVTVFHQTGPLAKIKFKNGEGSISSDETSGLVSRSLHLEFGVELDGDLLVPNDSNLAEIARNHRVEGLLIAHAQSLGLPASIEKDLTAQARANLIAGLELIQNTQTVGSLFEINRIDHLIFKGVALSALCSRDLAARGAGDIDVLVSSGDVPRVHRILLDNGFVPKTALVPLEVPMWKFWAFRDRELGYQNDFINLDLHWKIPRNPQLTATTKSQLGRSQEIKLATTSIRTLSPGDALNACAVHIYVDFCQNLRLLVDLVFLSNLPSVALPEDVPAPGRQLVADVLEFTRQLLGTPLVPFVEGVPEPSAKGVAYLNKMWKLNSGKPLAEARASNRSADTWGRLKHGFFYGLSLVEIARFLSKIMLDIPNYSHDLKTIGPLSALIFRLRQLLTGRVPHMRARKDSILNKGK